MMMYPDPPATSQNTSPGLVELYTLQGSTCDTLPGLKDYQCCGHAFHEKSQYQIPQMCLKMISAVFRCCTFHHAHETLAILVTTYICICLYIQIYTTHTYIHIPVFTYVFTHIYIYTHIMHITYIYIYTCPGSPGSAPKGGRRAGQLRQGQPGPWLPALRGGPRGARLRGARPSPAKRRPTAVPQGRTDGYRYGWI